VETDKAKRDAMIEEAFKISTSEVATVPLHQQALAWGKNDKVELRQRADNQFRFYYVNVK
ncbi:MAG: ABC transporter substrate-binding protein, partial [Nisaea sp.]